jgi:excisionase family DNA binding protein
VSGELLGRFRVVVVIGSDDRSRTPTPLGQITSDGGAMIELTVTLTDQQLAEIAEQAAALVSTGPQEGTPWLNVTDAAERLRCNKDRIYDLIALGKLHPHRDGRRVLLHRDDLDATSKGETDDLVSIPTWRCALACRLLPRAGGG